MSTNQLNQHSKISATTLKIIYVKLKHIRITSISEFSPGQVLTNLFSRIPKGIHTQTSDAATRLYSMSKTPSVASYIVFARSFHSKVRDTTDLGAQNSSGIIGCLNSPVLHSNVSDEYACPINTQNL